MFVSHWKIRDLPFYKSVATLMTVNKKSQSNLGKAALPILTQRIDSPGACAASCAMPISDESTQLWVYSASTVQCHILPIRYIPLSDPPKCPFLWDPHPTIKKSSPAYLTHWTNLPYLNVITDAHRTRKQWRARFSCRLAQSSPIGQLNHAKPVTMAT